MSDTLRGLLRESFKSTCVPNIANQLKVGLGLNQSDIVDKYCECVGLFYFNDISVSEYEEMKSTKKLPGRIASQQDEIRGHCLDLHVTPAIK